MRSVWDEIREREIRRLAYCLWEEAGRPEGRSDEFWLEAECQFGRNLWSNPWVDTTANGYNYDHEWDLW